MPRLTAGPSPPSAAHPERQGRRAPAAREVVPRHAALPPGAFPARRHPPPAAARWALQPLRRGPQRPRLVRGLPPCPLTDRWRAPAHEGLERGHRDGRHDQPRNDGRERAPRSALPVFGAVAAVRDDGPGRLGTGRSGAAAPSDAGRGAALDRSAAGAASALARPSPTTGARRGHVASLPPCRARGARATGTGCDRRPNPRPPRGQDRTRPRALRGRPAPRAGRGRRGRRPRARGPAPHGAAGRNGPRGRRDHRDRAPRNVAGLRQVRGRRRCSGGPTEVLGSASALVLGTGRRPNADRRRRFPIAVFRKNA